MIWLAIGILTLVMVACGVSIDYTVNGERSMWATLLRSNK